MFILECERFDTDLSLIRFYFIDANVALESNQHATLG